jgi:hypothetical protein
VAYYRRVVRYSHRRTTYRSNSGCGLLVLLGIGCALAVKLWPLLLALAAIALAVVGVQAYDKSRKRRAATSPAAKQAAAERLEELKQLAAAQPATSTDTFGTCPGCAKTNVLTVIGTTDEGTTRRCPECMHQWTVDHSNPATQVPGFRRSIPWPTAPVTRGECPDCMPAAQWAWLTGRTGACPNCRSAWFVGEKAMNRKGRMVSPQTAMAQNPCCAAAISTSMIHKIPATCTTCKRVWQFQTGVKIEE